MAQPRPRCPRCGGRPYGNRCTVCHRYLATCPECGRFYAYRRSDNTGCPDGACQKRRQRRRALAELVDRPQAVVKNVRVRKTPKPSFIIDLTVEVTRRRQTK